MPYAKGYDYVIIGSGTAGSTMASRLSEDENCRVLVLEAGGSDRGFWLRLPVGYFKSIYNSKVSHLYKSEPDAGLDGRQMDCPRGRVLGGSSSINGLIFIRGQHSDFDDWAELGATGWDYRSVLPHFRNVETYSGAPSQFRGAQGPVQVSELRSDNRACRDWMDAARQWGLPDNEDFNGASSHGVGRYDLTLRGHWRESAATAFLRPATARPNLTVETHATVTRLLFEGDRVTGVEYLQNGAITSVHAIEQVILCAGAVQSPQVLQLSGIGPEDVLKAQGIMPRYVSQEVGENLQDHLQMRTIVEMSDGRDSLNRHVRNPFKLAKMALEWIFGARGPLTVGAGQVGGALCTRYAQGDRPDLQLFVMPLSVDKPGAPLHRYPGFTTSFWQCHPASRGHIHIQSDDPLKNPRIVMNYLSAELDRRVMTEGLRIVRDIYSQPAFKERWDREIVPGGQYQDDAEILSALRKYASTVYHLVGTCRMGSDTQAVVAPDLKVNGVRGLRVVDASVMPKMTSANTNAATYMIAEKAASMIRGD